MSGFGATRYVPMSYYDSLADARRTLKENSLTSLEFQTALLEWLARSSSLPSYQQFMKVYGYQKVDQQEERETLGKYLHDNVRDVVKAASTFYVSPDMCELVRMAAEDMPVSGLQPTDMPTDTGFLVFDRPLTLSNAIWSTEAEEAGTEVDVRISAIAWRVGSVRKAPATDPQGSDVVGLDPMVPIGLESVPGLSYFLFQTPRDVAVMMNQDLAEGEDGVTADETQRFNGPLPIYDFSGWAFNTPWYATAEEVGHAIEQDGEQGPVSGVHSIVDQTRRLLIATWRILNQTNIVTLDPTRPPRHLRRRAERVGITPEDGDIVVIRMRREVFQGLHKAAGTEEDDVPWYTVRFMVRGHWHNYWVGPRGAQHLQPKYVLPYEKGPEGAPLVKRNKIFSLER